VKLTKAKEIIQLNLDEASPKMPPNVKVALTMGAGALERVAAHRASSLQDPHILLPGETKG